MELEMVVLTKDNIYKVKNFAKHQNIKAKKEVKSMDKEEYIANKEEDSEEQEEKRYVP